MNALPSQIHAFVVESNRIEGIIRPPTRAELDASSAFLVLERIKVVDVETFVHTCARAPLRRRVGMDVSVGEHVAPPGGVAIEPRLQGILACAQHNGEHPYVVHCEYETLHPFMDGNGRSGRILWAWQMLAHGHWPGLSLGFLHSFYYQALSQGRR